MSAALERAAQQWEAARVDRTAQVLAELSALRAAVLQLGHAQAIQSSEAVPVETAAALLGCKRTQVFNLLATGKLTPAPKQGRQRMITRASVDALLKVNADEAKAPRQRKPVPERDGAGWADEIRRLRIASTSPASDHPGGTGEAGA